MCSNSIMIKCMQCNSVFNSFTISRKDRTNCDECRSKINKELKQNRDKKNLDKEKKRKEARKSFTCVSCKRTHHIDLKTGEKDRDRCVICNAYKNHKTKCNTKTYEQIEHEYLARRSIRLSGEFVCVCCNKPVSKIHKRGMCADCWFSDNHRILRNAQKRIREGVRDPSRSKSFHTMFGFTVEQFMADMELKFTSEMNMNDFIAGKIHIDHIIPTSAFNHSDPEQFKACWSLDNMQPLMPRDNGSKGDYLPDGRSVADIRLLGGDSAVWDAVKSIINKKSIDKRLKNHLEEFHRPRIRRSPQTACI